MSSGNSASRHSVPRPSFSGIQRHLSLTALSLLAQRFPIRPRPMTPSDIQPHGILLACRHSKTLSLTALSLMAQLQRYPETFQPHGTQSLGPALSRDIPASRPSVSRPSFSGIQRHLCLTALLLLAQHQSGDTQPQGISVSAQPSRSISLTAYGLLASSLRHSVCGSGIQTICISAITAERHISGWSWPDHCRLPYHYP